MRLRPRLVLLLVVSTLIPLGLTGWMTAHLSRQNNIAQARQLQQRQAEALATLTESWREDSLRALELGLATWDVEQLSAAERAGLQRVLYRQLDAVNIVATVDRAGQPVVPPTTLGEGETVGELSLHQPVGSARLERLLSRIPAPGPGAVSVGQVYDPGDGQAAVLPVALASPKGELIVVVELSLEELEEGFAAQALPHGGALLMASTGDRILGPGEDTLPQTTAWLGAGLSGELEYDTAQGREILATFQGISGAPWTVVVSQERGQITAAGDAIALKVAYVYLLALVLVGATAAVSANQIARPMLALRRAAERIGQGKLGERVQWQGRDEIAELAETFNDMSERLQAQASTIQAKNQEIEGFNRELQDRVRARTRELEQSQARLVQSSRMAAVAQLGAGLAHELNNPIAGILGLSQLAQQQPAASEGLLQSIEGEALRCRDILQSLQRFSGAGGVSSREPLDLSQLLHQVLVLVRSSMEEAQVQVDLEPLPALPTLGDAALLGQAVTQLLRSLRANLAPGGRIRISGRSALGEVGLEMKLDGPARPSKDDWLASGMGFWVAQQVLHEHGGRLEEGAVASRVWTLWLPAAEDPERAGQ